MLTPTKKLLFALALLVGLSARQPLWAQNNKTTYTLQECIDQALQNNLSVRQRIINKEISVAELRQAKASLLPNINGSASHNYNYGTNIDQATYEVRRDQTRTNNFSLGASLPLFMGNQRLNNIKQSSLDLQASEQDILATKNDVAIQVVTSYLNILFAEELIKTAELQRSSTQQQLDRNRILLKAGSIAENVVLEVESQLATDELNIINAQNQGDIARISLKQLLGINNNEPLTIVVPEIPEPDERATPINPNEVYEYALNNLPAIKGADLRILSADRGLAVARGAYYPRLTFSGGVNSFYTSRGVLYSQSAVEPGKLASETLGFIDAAGTIPFMLYSPVIPAFIEEPYPFTDQVKNNFGQQMGFSLSLPIFNGLQTRTNVERARLNHLNARINADIARNNLRQTIEQAGVDALAAQRKYAAAKRQLAALQRNYDNAQVRLERGIINPVDFNVIVNNFRVSQSNLIQAKYEYTFKLKVLDFYQGKPLTL